jgi:hypothetical protein
VAEDFCVLQVQAFAEFGDLPANVDLIVLQQLPHSLAHNFIEVLITPNPQRQSRALCYCDSRCTAELLF